MHISNYVYCISVCIFRIKFCGERVCGYADFFSVRFGKFLNVCVRKIFKCACAAAAKNGVCAASCAAAAKNFEMCDPNQNLIEYRECRGLAYLYQIAWIDGQWTVYPCKKNIQILYFCTNHFVKFIKKLLIAGSFFADFVDC